MLSDTYGIVSTALIIIAGLLFLLGCLVGYLIA